MRWFRYGYLLIILMGCTLLPKAPELSPEQGVPFGVEDLPPGWYFSSIQTTGHQGWGMAGYYNQGFSTRYPEYLGARLFFLRYADVGAAQRAFNRHESGVFYSYMRPVDYWTIPLELNPYIHFADRYRVGCRPWGDRYPDQSICVFWAQYGSCAILFSSSIQGSLMTVTDFAGIVESAIDARMSDVSICYSD
jgi:hypothetical protein